jgi:extracellular elastinolytic metalloproteinase
VVGAEFTDTRGNNTTTRPQGGVPRSGGAFLNFDFPLNLSGTPLEQQAAATANLFYWTNWLHDVFYAYGFDEAAGNFQTNSYGRGGIGADEVIAELQIVNEFNNAQFLTLPDGQSGELDVFLFLAPAREVQVALPASIAASYPSGGAEFGPPPTGVTAEVVAAFDVVEAVGTATDACSPVLNGSALAGRIALVDRGVCLFVDKVRNVQAAGAVAMIIVNNAGNRVIDMSGADPNQEIVIPSFFVSQANGLLIREALSQGVTATPVRSDPSWRRDSAFSNVLIAHEYTHGVSTRLTAGPANVTCLGDPEASGLGEGWSDFFAISLTAQASDTRAIPRSVGAWVFGDPKGGPGFRNYQFSTDFNVNPQTYSDIADAVELGTTIPSVHGIGEIWANALWEIYWNLVDEYGFDPDLVNGSGGNNLLMQLVIDGMAMQPCEPTFLDARDAILLADQAQSGGANECAIWHGFARRGMGVSASDGGSASVTAVTDGFDAPLACPEPGAAALGIAALSVLALLSRRRRAT